MDSTQQVRFASSNGQAFCVDDVARTIRTFVVDNLLFGQGADHFSGDDSFLENGLIDSVGILTLVEFVRETYGVSIEDEELVPENWDSVHRIAAFIQTKLTSKAL